MRRLGTAKPAGFMRTVQCCALLSSAACTTLGPMPAMTGVPVTPIERTGTELQAAVVPGYYLSTTTQERPEASNLPQLLGLLEPDKLIGVPGLFAGARYAGDSDTGAALEPLLGYRAFLDADKRFSIMATGFLAYESEEKTEASFSAFRGGLDAGVDACLTGRSKYAELHTQLGLILTGLSADGRYCLDTEGRFGVDCPGAGDPTRAPPVSASVSGIFPSGHVGLSLEMGRHIPSAFQGIRLGADLAGGTMPSVAGGQQRGVQVYGTAGLSLTIGIGASQ